MKTFEYKAITFTTALLLALAWSWLPWLAYNGFALVIGILPVVGYYGYGIITAVTCGGMMAVVEHYNPIKNFENLP